MFKPNELASVNTLLIPEQLITFIHAIGKTVITININIIFRDKINCSDTVHFFLLGFIPYKAEQPLRVIELQEKKHKKDYRIQKISLERTYS